jgi:hypothetical protein
MDDVFDITRSYPPLVHPPKPLFDVEAIQALMVDASSKAEFIKATSEDPNVDNTTRQFATANLAFFALLTAVVEKAVILLANSPPPTWNRQHTDAPPPPLPPSRIRERKNLPTPWPPLRKLPSFSTPT